jgi:hypothetical protein
MNDIEQIANVNHSVDLLEKGIVNASSTVISLLGLDLIGIRQIKIVTTLETWLNYGDYLW